MEAIISRLISMGLFKYLGVGAIGIFIWYTGPYVAFLRPISHRLIAIAIVVVLAGLYFLVRKLLQRKKSRQLTDDLASNAAQETESDSAERRSGEEIATLKQKFDEALAVLKKSGKTTNGQNPLLALPWYMIIGPPGAGKTTLLVNSGLKFPLAEKMGLNKLQGVGGTRFCDWWFTEDAVIVDTAGRYTTQDSDRDVDNAAWMGFLRLLRKNRKRRPISGIIVAIAMDELTRQSEIDRERSAAAVSLRIQELYSELGVRFPIYVMFTKCDLLSGFMEYFENLDRNQREQVWGTTFQVDENAIEKLPQELSLLQEQLEARLVQRLQQERDPARRNLIYNFPSLFNAAQPLVTEFIERVFKPSRYTMTPLLRGVYFTSGTQEGTPFNRLISQLARSFSLSHGNVYSGPPQGRSYFIRNLLGSVIFAESGLAGVNIKADRIYRYISLAGRVAILVLPLFLLVAWWVSYSANSRKLEALSEETVSLNRQIGNVSELNDSLVSVLPVLDASRQLSFGYQEKVEDSVPLSMRFGLYQGSSVARAETIPAYRNVLENAFLSRILIRIERYIRENLSDPGKIKSALKAYSMLHHPDELDPEFVRSWVIGDWQRDTENAAYRQYQQPLQTHLDALLALQPITAPYEMDYNLVQHALSVIGQTPRSVLVYSAVKDKLLAEGEDFSLHANGGPKAPIALRRLSGGKFTDGVPFMFTPEGYKKFNTALTEVVRKEEDDDWLVMLAEEDVERLSETELIAQVSNLYVEDYIETWSAFLEDIRIQSYNSTEEAQEILQIITDKDSPLVQVLQGAAERTEIELGIPENIPATELLGNLPGDPYRINVAFDPLRRFVLGDGEQPSQLSGIQDDIRELMVLMNRVTNKGGIDYVSAQEKLDIANNADNIRLLASNAPQPMDELVSDIANQVSSLLAGSQKRNLNAAWRTTVNTFCQESIAGRYPFSASSKREVSLSEFTEFFGPGGRMDRFFDTHLGDLVDRRGGRWAVRPHLASVVPINSSALRQMQMANQIKQAFFPPGANGPEVYFTLTPERMDKQSASFTLHALGEQLNYQHDYQAPTRLRWPAGSVSFGGAQMIFKATDPGLPDQSRTVPGEWSWFRLLDESNPRPGETPDEFRITFSLVPHSIDYRLKAERTQNPFKLSLNTFRCVSNL